MTVYEVTESDGYEDYANVLLTKKDADEYAKIMDDTNEWGYFRK